MTYRASSDRYDAMIYNRCGRSGLRLPAISLGLWHNFGDDRPLETQRAILPARVRPGHHPFRPGQQLRPAIRPAEENFGQILASDFAPYRDELVISTKAGYDMWPGSVRGVGLAQVPAVEPRPVAGRMGLDYVDIFYSHRFDPDTPLEETMGALDTAVRQGKALYVGISSYSPANAPARRRGSCARWARRC